MKQGQVLVSRLRHRMHGVCHSMAMAASRRLSNGLSNSFPSLIFFLSSLSFPPPGSRPLPVSVRIGPVRYGSVLIHTIANRHGFWYQVREHYKVETLFGYFLFKYL